MRINFRKILNKKWALVFGLPLIVSVQGSESFASSATAGEVSAPLLCFIALGERGTDLDLSGSASVELQGCGFGSNSSSGSPKAYSVELNGSSSIKADILQSVGGLWTSNNAVLTVPTVQIFSTPIQDPLDSTSPTLAGDCTHENFAVAGAGEAGSTVTLSPGVYCGGITIRGVDHIAFSPGKYDIRDGSLTLQAKQNISGTEVHFLLSGADAKVDIFGQALVTLTAGTTDAELDGILIFKTREAEAQESSITALKADLKGSVYLPNDKLTVQNTVVNMEEGTLVVERYKSASQASLVIKASAGDGGNPPVTLNQ